MERCEKNPARKPAWLTRAIPRGDVYFRLAAGFDTQGLHTVCRSARCPNVGECWSRGQATFMILGAVCTRDCKFCAVPHGLPEPVNHDEGQEILKVVLQNSLKYLVITSVTRDDLADGGSAHFSRVISELKRGSPGLAVEVLVPDFKGRPGALAEVLQAGPAVLNHNVETVARLYPAVNRPMENYRVSLDLLAEAKQRGALTKSGLMVGLGENEQEILEVFGDLRRADVDMLTIGQYLQPGRRHQPVSRYYKPEEFDRLAELALKSGFRAVASGPLVRSSYQAESMFREMST